MHHLILPPDQPPPAALISAGLSTASATDFDSCYTIDRELGRGAHSVVYSAISKADGSEVAVKVLQKRKLGVGAERLRDEMRALHALRHPSIITLHETFEDDADLLIVTERAEGGELFDRIVEQGMFSEPHARQVMAQLLGAIRYMHSQGVMHRDIKPENLLLTSATGWDVKVSDFGLVKIVDGFDDDDGGGGGDGGGRRGRADRMADRIADRSGNVEAMTAAMGRLRATTMCGSGYYMAPEVFWRRGYGAAVDVWSCGVVMYILLSGGPPWESDQIPSPSDPSSWALPFHTDVWAQISAEAKDVLHGMLHVDTAQRLTAAAALEQPWFGGGGGAQKESSLLRRLSASMSQRLSLGDAHLESLRQFTRKRQRERNSSTAASANAAAQRARLYEEQVSRVSRGSSSRLASASMDSAPGAPPAAAPAAAAPASETAARTSGVSFARTSALGSQPMEEDAAWPESAASPELSEPSGVLSRFELSLLYGARASLSCRLSQSSDNLHSMRASAVSLASCAEEGSAVSAAWKESSAEPEVTVLSVAVEHAPPARTISPREIETRERNHSHPTRLETLEEASRASEERFTTASRESSQNQRSSVASSNASQFTATPAGSPIDGRSDANK